MANASDKPLEEYEKVQPPMGLHPLSTTKTQEITITPSYSEFPYPEHMARIASYGYYHKLFLGQHFDAFNYRIDNDLYGQVYSKLRYVMVNFAGLISKIIADMLFSEPITVKAPDGDQDFIDAVWQENNMDVQAYEGALANSYLGDDLWKLRIGKRHPYDKDPAIIIENTTPSIYFPHVEAFNVRAEPDTKELAWLFKRDNDTFLRKEIHTSKSIVNEIWKMNGNRIQERADDLLSILSLKPTEAVKIPESLLIHIPNWKTGSIHFGISDYFDIDTLFYAINNRMTKMDNVLDKHTDPILMVPPGVIDEKGRVKKKALGVVEVLDGETVKPEYIVWDANLDSAMKEVEKLVEFMYLIGEISPDILGLGEGISDSGRALKFKLLRTISKTARKKLYYDAGIKRILYVAQLLAKEYGITVNGKKIQKDPVIPEIEWADGLPIDVSEQLADEIKSVDANLTSRKAAIMRIYQVDDQAADKMIKDMDAEKPKVMPPSMDMRKLQKILADQKQNLMNPPGGKENQGV